MSHRLTVCLLATGLFSSGCGETPASATDAGSTADVGAPHDAAGGPWGCLGHVSPVVPGGTAVTITVHAVGFGSMVGMVGVTAKACARNDVMCAMPHSMGVTNAMGDATLTGPVGAQGFDGYIELTGGTGSNEVVPTKMYPNPPLAAGMRAVNARVIERETFTLLGSVLMADLTTRGLITAAASDCDHNPAEGVAFSSAPMPMGARQFYTVGSLPNLMATQTGPLGTGGYVNVPPGDYTLTTTRQSPMARVGSAAINVRAGYITSINIGPSP